MFNMNKMADAFSDNIIKGIFLKEKFHILII